VHDEQTRRQLGHLGSDEGSFQVEGARNVACGVRRAAPRVDNREIGGARSQCLGHIVTVGLELKPAREVVGRRNGIRSVSIDCLDHMKGL
jgi:hypothetical protein